MTKKGLLLLRKVFLSCLCLLPTQRFLLSLESHRQPKPPGERLIFQQNRRSVWTADINYLLKSKPLVWAIKRTEKDIKKKITAVKGKLIINLSHVWWWHIKGLRGTLEWPWQWHRSIGSGTWHKQHRESNWAERGGKPAQPVWWTGLKLGVVVALSSPCQGSGDRQHLSLAWLGCMTWDWSYTCVMLELPGGCLGQHKENYKLWTVILSATGSWFLREPRHSSISDSPRWWLQDPLEHWAQAKCSLSQEKWWVSLGPAPEPATAPRCFGWDGFWSWTSELKAGKRECLETGWNGKEKSWDKLQDISIYLQ